MILKNQQNLANNLLRENLENLGENLGTQGKSGDTILIYKKIWARKSGQENLGTQY